MVNPHFVAYKIDSTSHRTEMSADFGRGEIVAPAADGQRAESRNGSLGRRRRGIITCSSGLPTVHVTLHTSGLAGRVHGEGVTR